ncbi:MAG: tandem-95 repeat protein, partial [Burkholderiales bacterium]|nr:tandem-95 repeat protein [Burkholderiales bacterium]
MSKSAQVPGGTVTSIQGRATVIPSGEGAAHVLKVGDSVQAGDAVLTSAGTNLVITDERGNPWAPRDLILALAEANAAPVAKPGKSLHAKIKAALAHHEDTPADKDADQTIQAVNQGDADAAPAAGGGGGGSGSMTPGLRVDRVIEVLTTQEFSVGNTERGVTTLVDTPAAVMASAVADAVAKLSATDDTFTTSKGVVVGLPVLNNDGIDAATAPHVTAINSQTILPGGQVVVDHGVVQMSSTGALTFAPDDGYVGNQSFSYTVSNSTGQTANAAVTVSVVPPSAVPVANPDLLITQENKAVIVFVTANDDAGNQGPIQITQINGHLVTAGDSVTVSHGTVTLNADGSLTVTPDTHYSGDISFAYTVADQAGQTANATVNVQVTPVNDVPVIGDPADPTFVPSTGSYAVTTNEDKPVSGHVTATDADGDTLTFAKGSDPAHGSVTVNADGTWTYTPAKDYNGSDSFTVTVSDGQSTTTSTINVGVTPVNDPPSLGGNGTYSVTTPEDHPISGQVVATDIDGDALTYAKGVGPEHGSVTVNADGTWTYTPAKDYNGSDSFTVTVSDGHDTVTSTVNVGVTPVNDPPSLGGNGTYSVTTPEDQPISGQVMATDVDGDGDALTYAKGVGPEHGSVTVNADGTWTYTPAKDYNGSDSFTVTVSDGHDTVTSTVNVGVTPVNDPPSLGNNGTYSVTTPEDQPVSGQVVATDVDGDALTYAKGVGPEHGSVTVNADGTWTYTPSKDYNGNDSFTVTVSDGKDTVTSTVNVGVIPVNDPPSLGSNGTYSVTTPEDHPISGQVVATDVDGDTLTYAKGVGPAHGSVTVNADGTWTYTPAKDYNGSDSFTVTVSDGHDTVTSTVNVGVTPVNDPPSLGGNGTYNVTTPEDQPISGQVVATDVDGDALTYAKGVGPEHGSVTVNADGTWTYTPSKDYNGSDSFTVTVSDGQGGTTTSTINVGVTPVNDAPTMGANSTYTVSTLEDQPVSGQVVATDVDGDTLTYAKGTDPAHGAVTVNADGTWTYTPAKDYNGSDSFTVTVSDGHGGTTTSTVNVGIRPVNDAPTAAASYSVTTLEDQPVSGQVVATDVDGDTLTYAKGTDPVHGAVTVNADGTWTYTPTKDYNGSDSFTVTVSDGHGGTTTSTVNV